ncbi:putative RNA-dependent RNA polymerase 5 isoform X2 [Silene latifolia]|uniref:putative RNA-dependent RNA polymerase 5 isoform X2 n=1 Tax=Silene latifolia TaxID=37657 RepID=UPI003D7826DD
MVLSAAVENLLEITAREKSQPPANAVARKFLAEIGEEQSIDVLSTILSMRTTIINFSALIVHLAKQKKPKKMNDNDCLSPTKGSPNPVTTTHRSDAFASPSSTNNTPPIGDALPPNKRRRTLNFPDDVVASFLDVFVPASTTSEVMVDTKTDQFIGSATASKEKADMGMMDSLTDALTELEFRKAFLILNYKGRKQLEDVITAEKIRSLSRLDMNSFEFHIWNDFGRGICKENERRKYLDWESGRYLTYHCHVYGDASYSFKGPFLNKTTTLLQKEIGDENVLIVKFLEDQTESIESGSRSVMSCPAFNKISQEGIFVGRKHFQFFVFKDGGKAEKKKNPASSPVKCYFVNKEAFASFFDEGSRFFQRKTIQDARSMFMHIHKASSVANYMARFSLILSKTVTLDVNLDDVHVQDIDDVLCLDEKGEPVYMDVDKPHIHTDGTGFISEDLALKCPLNCFMGFAPDENNIKRLVGELPETSQLISRNLEPPLLIQFRMFHKGRAIKGTVLLNRKLPPKTIQVRPSMIKIKADPELAGAPTLNRFEIVGTSNKPKRPRLSKNLISLLHYGGVPKEFFLERLDDALKDVHSILYKKRGALKVAINRDADEDFTVARMILSGLPLDEPFLQHRLSEIVKEERKNLKAGKIPISNSFYVMGTADPTDTLNCGEVCVILEHGQISGPVLVYRNPGIHPGDIHVVNARYVKALEEIVGNSKYGIFFPSKGPRSMADEIAGGDYDGDMYWVSRDPELLAKFKPSSPWKSCPSSLSSSSRKVDGLSDEVLERELFRLYLRSRFQPSKAMGVAADCWLVYMDRLLTLGDECSVEKECVKQKIWKLIDRYYDALDAPKKGIKIEVPPHLMPGKFPHHMERGENCTYHSNSILGEIYDQVDNYNHHLDKVKVWMLPYFKEQIEQIPAACRQAWRALYEEYRSVMSAAMNVGQESKNESATAVYRFYKKILYGIGPEDEADELEKSRKSWNDIRVDALAVYSAAYEYAAYVNDPQKCNFAWKVAGSALFKMIMEEQGEKPICCAPSVLREVFR